MKTIGIGLLSLVLALHVEGRDLERENPEKLDEYSFETRMIFYAVLEGLYEDGVAGEALKLILPDPTGMSIEGEPEKANFVYACPICTPTFNALRLYASREPFYGQKATRYNTFGPGLEDGLLERMKTTPQERRKVIEELVARWVGRRLDGMKLSGEERKAIEANLDEMKKRGEDMLKKFQEGEKGDWFRDQYVDWKGCAICAGAAGE